MKMGTHIKEVRTKMGYSKTQIDFSALKGYFLTILIIFILGCGNPRDIGGSVDRSDTGTGDAGTYEIAIGIDELLSAKSPEMKKISSCEELEYYISKFIKDVFSLEIDIERGVKSGFERNIVEPTYSESVVLSESKPSVGEDIPEYSRTNVQEKGIDEPDYVKTDGKFIYVSAWGEIKLIDVFPPGEAPEKITEISLVKNQDEDRHIWYYYQYYLQTPEILVKNGRIFAFEGRSVHILKIENREIIPEKTYVFDGSYFTARDMGNYILVIAKTRVDLSKVIGASQSAIVDSDQKYTWDFDVEKILPSITEIDYNDGKITEIKISCEEIVVPSEINGSGVILTLKIDDGGKIYEKRGFLIDSRYTRVIPYITKGSIYFAFSPFRWWWAWINFIGEEGPTEREKPEFKTVIYKIDISDENTEFVGGTELEGVISSQIWGRNSQFSMSEHKGFLRVALEIPEPLENIVYVLDEELNVVGKVGGIGKGERIYAVRFVGDRGYVVTFRWIDPFFVIDLSDPKNPEVKGELEVPGFSTYLHPVGENLVLALGIKGAWDTTLSLYDVSDAENPELLTRITISTNLWSYTDDEWVSQWEDSSAHYDYRTLTFFRNFISIPFSLSFWSYIRGNNREISTSLHIPIFKLIDVDSNKGEIEYKGDISHTNFCKESSGEWIKSKFCGFPIRTVFIGDYIYTISTSELKVSNKELKDVWKIPMEKQ